MPVPLQELAALRQGALLSCEPSMLSCEPCLSDPSGDAQVQV